MVFDKRASGQRPEPPNLDEYDGMYYRKDFDASNDESLIIESKR